MYQSQLSYLYMFLAIAVPLALVESMLCKAKGRAYHDNKDSFCNLLTLAIGFFVKPLFVGYTFFFLKMIEGLTLFDLPQTLATTIAAIIATDFVYYWHHRWSHTNRWLWILHEVHHSSKYFNLTTSFRLPWLGRLTAPIFFVPLVLLGFQPEQVSIFLTLNLFYQYFLHTQTIGTLPLVEGTLNTPSAHRVHHSRNKEFLNKNYGGILMIWDRLFGTYQAEIVAPKFGIIGTFESYNPVTVQFHKLKGYGKVTEIADKFVQLIQKSLVCFMMPSGKKNLSVDQEVE